MHHAPTSLNWTAMVVATGDSHHLLAGTPAYPNRYLGVGVFRPPGLAVARDKTGAFHITPLGVPAYEIRFLMTFGFYEGLAATQSSDGWLHIESDGKAAYGVRFDWVGNWQQNRCVVRTADGHYFHIRRDGNSAYDQHYIYAGDFREGAAVVQRADGKATHIDPDGLLLHDRWFLELDVFHKGFSRARDSDGWHHVNRAGKSAYRARFEAVDCFYNGQAWVKSAAGEQLVINEQGDVVRQIR
jgi:hypothetical protein